MAQPIRIQDLLQGPYLDDLDSRNQAGSGRRHDMNGSQLAFRPGLVLNTSTPIETDTLGMEPSSSVQSRKRKSPVERDVIPIKKPIRLPRFSVNIFHLEPLNVFPIPSDGCVPRMVRYYVQVWAPQHGRALAVEGHPKPYQSLVFPYALEHGVLFEALVALGRASWLLQEGIPWSKDSALVYHRANAFAALRLRFAGEKTCADDTTILTIAALTTIDYLLGIHEGAERHIYAMQRIRKIRVDLRDDTPWNHLMIVSMDAYEMLWKFVKDTNEATASMSQLTPESPMRNDLPLYPSLPFSIKVCEALSKVSSAFNDIAIAGELSTQMIDILASLSAATRCENHSEVTAPDSPPSSPCGRSLLSIIADLRCLTIMSVTPIEYMLCHGMLGCCLTLHFTGSRIGEEFNDTLQELEGGLIDNGRMRSQPESALKPYRECLIWISMAAAGALEMAHHSSATSAVLAQTLQRYPDETGDWDTLQKILAKYLWNDVLALQWKKCWRRGIHRQKRLRR